MFKNQEILIKFEVLTNLQFRVIYFLEAMNINANSYTCKYE